MAPPPPPPPICLPFFGSKPKRRLSGSSTSPVIYSGHKKSLSQTGAFESDARGDLGVYHHAGQTYDTRSNPPGSQNPATAPSGTGFTEFEANMGFGDLHSPKKDLKGKGKAVPVVGPDGVPMHVNAAGMSMEVNPPHGPISPDAKGAGGVAWAPTAENEMVHDDGSSWTSDTRTMTESMWSGDENAGRPSSAYTTLTFRTDTEDYAAVPRDAVDRKGRIVRSNTMAGGMPKVKEKDGMTLKLGKGMKMTVATAGPALTTHGSVSRPLPAPMSRASTLPSVGGDGAARKDSLMGTHVIPSPAPAPKAKRGFLGFGGKRKPVQLAGVGAGGGGLPPAPARPRGVQLTDPPMPRIGEGDSINSYEDGGFGNGGANGGFDDYANATAGPSGLQRNPTIIPGLERTGTMITGLERTGTINPGMERSGTKRSGRALPDFPTRRPNSAFSQDTLLQTESMLRRRMDDDAESVHVRVDTSERLEGVRKLMGRERVGIYIIPNNDEHGTEGVAACDQRREYISGFTGPIGTAIVTTSAAYLLAPSRYHAQAATQIDENWTFVPSIDWMAYLATIATEEVRVGIDGRLISHTAAAKLTKMIPSKVVYPVTNLVDASWKDRPPAPLDPIFVQAPSYSGEEASSKLDRIRAFLQSRPPDRPSYAKGTPGPQNYVIAILLTRMDEVAWALNLRGSDIPFTPIFRAYFFLSASLAVLFVNPEKLPQDVSEHLAALSVSVRPYADVWKFLRKREWEVEGKVIIAPDASYSVALVLSGYRTAVMPSPVRDMMALKNPVELEGLRRAYLRDGVAIVQFFAWLEEKLVHKGYDITEWEAAQRLLDFRKAQAGAGFMGLAGLTKAQSGVNASEEGYVARKATARRVDKDSPFVLSAGAQYRDGTTSTTRTIHLGDPRPEHIDAYTRVLQGHMAIDAAVFPAGTNAAQLDVLARGALWKGGMDYGHPTGTGIGSFLTTSEGPHGFTSTAPLQPGCAITNVQGAYIPSRFGIRLESVLVAKKTHPRRTAGIGGIALPDLPAPITPDGKPAPREWLAFERLTCVPIQPSLVRWDVLGPAEKAWIQTHNADCLRKLRPFLGADKRALEWVRRMAEVMP